MSKTPSPSRHFRHTYGSHGPLARNAAHNFALGYTMEIYGTGAIYSFIPKNACSTLRFSVAKANGMVSGLDDINWIHRNNNAFNVDTADAARAPFTFAILRCPFSRLYSAYMDKIVGMDLQSWALRNETGRGFEVYDLSFRRFIHIITSKTPQSLDQHWRPQIDFLLYENYDTIYAFEDFANAIPDIEHKAGLVVEDTRDALGHHTAKLKHRADIKEPMRNSALTLLNMRRSGEAPEPTTMFNEEIIGNISRYYAEDLKLYRELFGSSKLMTALLP